MNDEEGVVRRIVSTYKQGIIGGLIAVLLTSALPAIAAVGDALRLGERNAVGRRTALTGSVGTQNLQLVNKHATGEALYLGVEKGNPPLVVNSNRRVRQLNSDLLDNRHANQLVRAAGASTADVPTGADVTISAFVGAPTPGMLLISASVDAEGPDLDVYHCALSVNNIQNETIGTLVPGSWRTSAVHQAGPETTYNSQENCATDGHIAVPAGDWSVNLRIMDVDPPTDAQEAAISVLFVPFDGFGNVPSPHPDLLN